jgi:hypothetical protein
MATCECGINFVQAALDGREIESYAVVHDEDYQRVIGDELAIRSEADEERRLALIAEVSTRVGSLHVCPECGALILSKPQRSSTHGSFTVLRESSGPNPT